MTFSLRSTVPALFLVTATAMGCGSPIVPVPYTPHPDHVADARAEVKRIVLGNTTEGCISEPEWGGNMLVVKFACTRAVGNAVLKVDRVKTLVLEQSGEWYRVRVTHSDTTPDFAWSSKSLEDMQHLADAVAKLSGRGPVPAPTASGTTI